VITNISKGWSIKKELSWPLQAIAALWLSVIFTLYLAPSVAKYQAADMFAALFLALGLAIIRVRSSEVLDAIKPVAPPGSFDGLYDCSGALTE
jgi:hypothetical protein